jgi:hypothetical protein
LGDVDVNTWTAATRRYTSLRRRYWRFSLGMPALAAVLGTPLFVFDAQLNPLARNLLAASLAVGFMTCWFGSLVTTIALMRFRCPACGGRFIVTWYSTWPSATCKHCDLHLGGGKNGDKPTIDGPTHSRLADDVWERVHVMRYVPLLYSSLPQFLRISARGWINC